ncbi:hypothetical protein WHX56_06440 [Achromobacter veterisilvae]|uniref:Uncharacterized protein n=1 Tax=Achromobacter veterisilvae TaxID=2069367 RepID=A0ABZ2S529_9BURK
MTPPVPPVPDPQASALHRWLMAAGALMGTGALFPNVVCAPPRAGLPTTPLQEPAPCADALRGTA